MTNLTEVLYPVCPAVSCCVYLASVSLLQQVESCSLDACVETEFCPVSCIIVSRQGLLSVSGTCVRLHGPQTGGYYSIHDWKPHYFRLHLLSPLVPRLSRQHFGLMYSAQCKVSKSLIHIFHLKNWQCVNQKNLSANQCRYTAASTDW